MKYIPSYIIDFVKKFDCVKPTRVPSLYPDMYSELVALTDFLPDDVPIRRRFYHIINTTKDIPKCEHCGSDVGWSYTKNGYNFLCGNKSCTTKNESSKKKRKEAHSKFVGGYAARDPKVQEKRRQTCIERYGVEYPMSSPTIEGKRKSTMMERYGVEYGGQSEELRERRKQTCLDRYGVEHFQQRHMKDVLELINDHDWLYDQYITKNATAESIANELGIDDSTLARYLHKAEIEIKQYCWHSSKCNNWLESIVSSEGICIQHALNGGEYRIPGTMYKVDGYCEETNTIYEFHGDYWHGNPIVYSPETVNIANYTSMGDLYQKTIDREDRIRSLGYNLITIWESEYDKQ